MRIQEPGVRSQESGDRITMLLFFFCILTPVFSYKRKGIHKNVLSSN
uniref:Uncharacterized protein n=1 Tax=uncultured Desulfobacterium sp. TaxID=201089 RepID=E1YJC3_9BACT|nr:unknown protein [uncultured Desulfobacterium sp.]